MAKRKLTGHQVRRIQQSRTARREAARERIDRQLDEGDGKSLGPETRGIVITSFGHTLVVEGGDGTLQRCVARRTLETPVCGDRVFWQTSTETEGVIVALEHRRSILARPDHSRRSKPLATNIDQVLVVIAPRPEPSEALVDRYLAAVEAMGVEALVVLNKSDLLQDPVNDPLLKRLAVYENVGYPVVQISTKTGEGLAALGKAMRRGTGILLGQSGVGKSSLVKALLPHQEIAIRAISQTTGLGTHTTTNATLYHLETGGDLIDSPGVRSFEPALTADQVASGYLELAPFLGHCKFSNCSHTAEPQCALKQAVEAGKVDRRRFSRFLDLQAQAGLRDELKYPL